MPGVLRTTLARGMQRNRLILYRLLPPSLSNNTRKNIQFLFGLQFAEPLKESTNCYSDFTTALKANAETIKRVYSAFIWL